VQKSVHRIFGRTRATVLGAALLSGAALPAAGLWAGTASALPNPNCVTTGITVTCTFSSTGSAISWPVPAGITHLTVTADGASGASATSSFVTGGGAGGRGGEYRATLTGIPGGTTLSVFPGRAAIGVTGGINAGGHGGNGHIDPFGNSGGGGGASTVAVFPVTLAHVLAVAGGGGGAGAENQTVLIRSNGGTGGGSGGVTGLDGNPVSASGRGRGGTTVAGGANGGISGCTVSATSGSQLIGGNSNSGTCAFAGGGGGSGYFGGGGSSVGAGAGGGSAFPAGLATVAGIHVFPDTTDHATHLGNGVVTISYRKVPTHLTAYIAFNIFQTFTVSGRLDSFFTPVAGQPLIFRSGNTFLCVAFTNSHGIGSCVLSYAKSVAIRQNAGRFTVIFPGSAGYLGSIALGQGIIHP
jgi:hypothetical protein